MSGRKRQRWQTRLIAVAIIILGVLVAGSLALVSIYRERQDEDVQTALLEEIDRKSSDKVVWNGTEYTYNDHLTNYLLLGIDNRERADTSTGQANAGQADAIYLIVRDRLEDTVTMITIPRDTMTEIELFGPGGESLGANIDHISLSYAYGDGGYESCGLSRNAVSNLFYGLPIQSYCALNLDSIPILTESVGSLEVTVPNDSLEEIYPEFTEGEKVTLDADNTEIFVRYRDTEKSQSALTRMERQQEYMQAFGQAAKDRQSEDNGFAVELYQSLEPYMVTNMNSGEFAELAESMMGGTVLEGWTVPGEGVEGDTYDEYHVDDEKLYAKIIETFYEEAE